MLLTEYVRQSIRRAIVKPYLNAAGELAAYFVDGAVEQMVEKGVEHGEQASVLGLDPRVLREMVERLAQKVGAPDSPVVAITSAGARYFLRQITESSLPNLFVLSHNEVPPGVRVVSLGVLP